MKNSFKLTIKRLSIAASLSIGTLVILPASATSPIPNQFKKPAMITMQHNTSENYQKIESVKMFPKPIAGQVQHILQLAKRDNEHNFKVEIEIGQNKLVDCNKHQLTGDLNKQSLQGWGYPYYTVESMAEGPSTMMMCVDPKSIQFVVMGKSKTINYDSRLPKVFYLPEDATLRYRVWEVQGDYEYSNK